MRYRRIQTEDFSQIKELCEKSGVAYDNRVPFVGFVAEADEGKIVGVIFAHSTMLLEPFIAEYPSAAVKLFYLMEGALSVANTQLLIAHVNSNKEKLISELDKVGFKPVAREYIVFKKEV